MVSPRIISLNDQNAEENDVFNITSWEIRSKYDRNKFFRELQKKNEWVVKGEAVDVLSAVLTTTSQKEYSKLPPFITDIVGPVDPKDMEYLLSDSKGRDHSAETTAKLLRGGRQKTYLSLSENMFDANHAEDIKRASSENSTSENDSCEENGSTTNNGSATSNDIGSKFFEDGAPDADLLEAVRLRSDDAVLDYPESRFVVASVRKTALLKILVHPFNVDHDFETVVWITFPLFFSPMEVMDFLEEWAAKFQAKPGEEDAKGSLAMYKSPLVAKTAFAKLKCMMLRWASLAPEDFSQKEDEEIMLERANKILMSICGLTLTRLPAENPLHAFRDGNSGSAAGSLGVTGGRKLLRRTSSKRLTKLLKKTSTTNVLTPPASPNGNTSPRSLNSPRSPMGRTGSPRNQGIHTRDRSSSITGQIRRRSSLSMTSSSSPFTSANTMGVQLLSLSPLLVAQQLTASAWMWFDSIGAREWLTGSWSGNEVDELVAPGIFNLTMDFNFVHLWVSSAILECDDVEPRAAVVEYFINVLEYLINFQNFHSAMSIMSALSSTPVSRLKRTWKQVSSKAKKSFQTTEAFLEMERNFANLRKVTYEAQLPLLPYVGITLSDLTSLRESLDRKGTFINLGQCQTISLIIGHMRYCKSQPHTFRQTDDFLKVMGEVEIRSPKALYERSTTVEKPDAAKSGKEKKSEKKKDDNLRGSGSKLFPSLTRMRSSTVEVKDPADMVKFSNPLLMKSAVSPRGKDLSLDLNLALGSEDDDPVDAYILPPTWKNPLSNRFLPAQVRTLQRYTSQSKDPSDEEAMAELLKKLGRNGAGGLYIGRALVMLWLRHELKEISSGRSTPTRYSGEVSCSLLPTDD